MYNKSPRHIKNVNDASKTAHDIKVSCRFCQKELFCGGIKKHEDNCYLNPTNYKECPVCSRPVKNFRYAVTCGASCANKKYRTGPSNGNWKQSAYVTTCFLYHKKECVVCGENLIVEVHHLDGDRSNNDPSNLIPLCSTHHKYWHSRYRHLVEPVILKYLEDWKKAVSAQQDSNLR